MKSTTIGTVRQLKGDGLRVNVDTNEMNLKVSGDGCRVTVARNCGVIRVVGDGCSLKVNRNEGEIEYEGDGGSIMLGGGSRTESVSYVGDGGSISVRSEGAGRKKVKTTLGKKKKEGGEKTKKPGFCSVSDSELEINLENAANERKEGAAEKKGDNRNERNLRRSKTIVITKISAEQLPVNINNNNHLIKNWFKSSPSSIIRSSRSQPESL